MQAQRPLFYASTRTCRRLFGLSLAAAVLTLVAINVLSTYSTQAGSAAPMAQTQG